MIPVKLALRNFMPYKDNIPPLDFTGIHTASIWGENGNGKSALIDAITWALWGKSRARSDDDLIHQGMDEVEVQFDFAVGQDIYRIIRKRARPKGRRASGVPLLELQKITPNGAIPLTGNTISDTEKEIIKIIRMDYDTFINSAYLRQGHADEFTVATPSKRKQVLADILGLSIYDELEEKAKEAAKKLENESAISERVIQDISEELGQKPLMEAALAQAQTDLTGLDAQITDKEGRIKELRQRKEVLDARRDQLVQIEKHLTETGRALAREEERRGQHLAKAREYEALIARRTEIEQGSSQFTQARKLNEELSKKLTFVSGLNQKKHNLNLVIERAQSAILTDHKVAESRQTELNTAVNNLPTLREEVKKAQAAMNVLGRDEEALRQKRQAEQQITASLNSFAADKMRLEAELAGISEKIVLLEHQTGAACPLCERELGAEHRQLIQQKYASEKTEKAGHLKAAQAGQIQKQSELRTVSAEIPRLEAALNKAKADAQNRISRLEKQIEDAEKAKVQAEDIRHVINELEKRLTAKDFALQERAALALIESELESLGYDSVKHEEARRLQAELEKWESIGRQLEEADRLVFAEREAVAVAEKAAQDMRASIDEDTRRRQALLNEIAALPEVNQLLDIVEKEYKSLAERQNQAQQSVGGLKNRLSHFSELEVKLLERKEAYRLASNEAGIYRELARSFGKNGVQAWLIEMVLPELTVEANKLLARMTDNRMHLLMDSQRLKKSGESAETLDIKISDELGTRNYEMFSGGEAFRINFAVRIALSRLLAHRAGAPLPTLIIDEGFGTQDASGLEKLKEAIISVQDDFKMILVITHVEDMRDAFPVRINVTKTAEGAMIAVN